MAQYDELIGELMDTDSGHPECDARIRKAIAALTDLQAQLAQEREISLAMIALLEEMRCEMNGLGERGDYVR